MSRAHVGFSAVAIVLVATALPAPHLGQLAQEQWYRGFAQSAGHAEQGTLRIATLEITRDIATVKVVEDYATSRYTDYLSLVNFDGAWKIVNKVYTSERR